MAKQKSKLPGKSQQHIRMNFLCQAASLMATLSNPMPPQATTLSNTTSTTKDRSKRRPYRSGLVWQEDSHGYHALSRYYNTTMKKIGQRMVLRLDPQLKRTICKRCSTSLIPAMTSTVRIQARPETTTVTKCNICGDEKRWVARPGHELFSDRPEVHYNRSTSDDENEEEGVNDCDTQEQALKRAIDVDQDSQAL
ncbi:hypothetical protein [Absidia glauca]|uniref:Rpr2-domain-containing protein n=1 Tax=Absidia glauca TaxID=4829 RepID=A0A163JH19_ABSGL|nr:hypothetical protein [Absidia glauca]